MSMNGPLDGLDRPPAPNAVDKEPARRSRSTFVGRHWRGEFELGPSYWICGALVSVIVTVLVTGIGQWAAASLTEAPRMTSFVVAAVALLTPLLMVWQVVGIWRSAGRRAAEQRRAGRGIFWSVLARIAVIFGILVQGINIAAYRVPNAVGYLKIAVEGDQTPRHVIRVLNGGRVIALTGGFDFGTAADFRTVLAASPDVRTVELNNTGGRVVEAEQVRRMIAERHLSTYTETLCASACTVAYIGGNPRYLSPGGKLEFHQYTFPGMMPSQVAEQNRLGEQTLIDAGVSPAFARKAFTTPPEQLWAPDVQTLLAAHVITQQVSGYWPAVTGINPADFMRGLDSVASFAAIRKYDGADYARIEQIVSDAVRTGVGQQALLTQVHAVMLAALARYRPIAGDDVQVEGAKLVADEASALAPSHPATCLTVLLGTGPAVNYQALLPADLQQRDIAVSADIISSGASAPSQVRASPRIVGIEMNALLAQVRADGLGDAPFGRKPTTEADQRSLCRAMSDLFLHLSLLPPDRAGRLMRSLAAQR